MPRSPTPARSPARSPEAVAALLRDLGPQLRRGAPEHGTASRLPTGIAEVDDLLAGGFPRGRLSEIAGPLSSGRTSLALALLAGVTRAGELAAVVDGADAFDPPSAEAARVDLERVLWARAEQTREALRCAERVLEARGFALVLLDLAEPPPRSAWIRLSRAAAGAGTAVVALSTERAAGPSAEVALETRLAGTHFTGTPTLLERLDTEVVLVRCRAAPTDRIARVRLKSSLAAA